MPQSQLKSKLNSPNFVSSEKETTSLSLRRLKLRLTMRKKKLREKRKMPKKYWLSNKKDNAHLSGCLVSYPRKILIG